MSHECHNPQCRRPCAPKYLMCRACWFAVPKALRDAVWAAYQPGQERRAVRPTRAWFAAARAAIASVRKGVREQRAA